MVANVAKRHGVGYIVWLLVNVDDIHTLLIIIFYKGNISPKKV